MKLNGLKSNVTLTSFDRPSLTESKKDIFFEKIPFYL